MDFTARGIFECLKAAERYRKVKDDTSPESAYCKAILNPEWLTKERCKNLRDIHRYVMCLAWELIEKENLAFEDAIRGAWRTAKILCRELGAGI